MYALVVHRFEAIFQQRTGRSFSMASEGLWKSQALDGRDECIPPFKTLTMQPSSLHHKDVMWDGYRLNMLLYALNELFYIYNQVTWQQGVDKKISLPMRSCASCMVLLSTLQIGSAHCWGGSLWCCKAYIGECCESVPGTIRVLHSIAVNYN